jgi:hypothetical protein
LGGGSVSFDAFATSYLSANANNDGTGWKYVETRPAGQYRIDNNAHAWFTAASGTAGNAISFTQAMTLDASGRLLVGTTSAPSSAGVKFVIGGVTSPAMQFASTSTGGGALEAPAGAGLVCYTYTGAVGSESYTERARISADGTFRVKGAGTAGSTDAFQVSGSAPADAARLDSSGNLLVGKTSYGSVAGVGSQLGALGVGIFTAANDAPLYLNRTSSDGFIAAFYKDGTNVGSISVTSTATAYNTSSDYRLKNTIAPMTGALAKVALLKPCTYKWNVDGSDGQGFIAHELAAVCPQAVSGEKDGVDAEGNPQYQGIDTSFLVATLTAAIQEQQALINDLRARVAALEA